ncbi:MAG: hypothetical protein ACYCX4_06280 [Bacillota bacterium]
MSKSYPEGDYDLHDIVLQQLAASYDVSKAAQEYAAQVKGKSADEAKQIADDFFTRYGTGLIEKTIELGDQYKDRTAEWIEIVAKKTGVIFPAIPQRHLETSMLATRPTDKWQLHECSQKRISYSVNQCSLYNALKETAGDVAENSLPCSASCLSSLGTLFSKCGVTVTVDMEKKINQDGACKFNAVLKK